MKRVGIHRMANLEPILGLAAMLFHKGGQYALVIGKLVAWAERAGEELVEIGQEIEPCGFVMFRFWKHAVPGNGGIGRGDVDLAHPVSPKRADIVSLRSV